LTPTAIVPRDWQTLSSIKRPSPKRFKRGVSVGGWVELAKWEVQMVTMATLVFATGAPAGEFGDPATAMACGMLSDALGDAIPAYQAYDSIFGTLDTIGLDTGAPMLCGGDGPC
jgi:hypothetical protein